jgi:hypothetical protein
MRRLLALTITAALVVLGAGLANASTARTKIITDGDLAVSAGPRPFTTPSPLTVAAAAFAASKTPSYLFTLGDNLNQLQAVICSDGTLENDYEALFDPTWGGTHVAPTVKPSIGNHDLFCDATGTQYEEHFSTELYYRFSVDSGTHPNKAWIVFSLDSELTAATTPTSADQLSWLRASLRRLVAHPAHQGVVAFWHRPLFTTGPSSGTQPQTVKDLWATLVDYHGAAGHYIRYILIFNGHDHMYERYPAYDEDGNPPSGNMTGAQEFIVASGGADPMNGDCPATSTPAYAKCDSQLHNGLDAAHVGLLKLKENNTTGYASGWAFIVWWKTMTKGTSGNGLIESCTNAGCA